MRSQLTAEAIGTFAIVFAGTGAIVINDVAGGVITHVGIALTFGLVVMAMIYTFGETSGAHLNPAVTIGFYVAGRTRLSTVAPYIVAQLAGALAASALIKLLFNEHPTLGATIPAGSGWQSLILEIVLTFLLMLVILQVSSGSKEVGTLAGIAIGGVIALEAMFAGPICGASMNPARSIAPALLSGDSQILSALWIYLAGPTLGVLAAIPIHRLLREQDRIPNHAEEPNGK